MPTMITLHLRVGDREHAPYARFLAGRVTRNLEVEVEVEVDIVIVAGVAAHRWATGRWGARPSV